MPNSLGMPTKTAEIFVVIAKAAEAHKTITYKEVGEQVGLHWRQVPNRLYAIWQWCDSRNLPHLNAIVVSGKTHRPGSGYTPSGVALSESEFQKMKERVFHQNWKSISFPS